jgi:hypothetical protein
MCIQVIVDDISRGTKRLIHPNCAYFSICLTKVLKTGIGETETDQDKKGSEMNPLVL